MVIILVLKWFLDSYKSDHPKSHGRQVKGLTY